MIGGCLKKKESHKNGPNSISQHLKVMTHHVQAIVPMTID
jgi:hypothetical protein